MIWDHGRILKPRSSFLRVLVVHASLPGPPGFRDSSRCTMSSSPITQDVAVWAYSVNILLEFTAFLATLHWPQGAADLGEVGTSFLELLIMLEVSAGHS